MKKFLFCLLIALLALTLAACGGGEDTTTAESTTTEADVTTTEADVTTTEADVTTTEADVTTTEADVTTTAEEPDEDEPIDIMNNMENPEYNTVKIDYDGLKAFAFEDFHVDLDYNVALVIKMEECDACLYEEFFYTLSDNDNSQYEINASYKWEVVIDGEEYPISRITLANYATSGWVRLDLGSEFSFNDFEYDNNNIHYLDARINIYDAGGKLAYYAYLTDPEWNGPYPLEKPVATEIGTDKSRPSNVTALAQGTDFTAVSGPMPGSGENFLNLFDNSVRTKLCTGDNGVDNAIVVRITSDVSIVGISLVNANDNETYTSRTLVTFDIWTSEDGAYWGEAPVISIDGSDITDRGPISTNYLERYYALDVALDAPYIRLVANNGDTYQMSELIFFVEK